MFKQTALSRKDQVQFVEDLSNWLADGQAANKALEGMEILAVERGNRKEQKVIQQLRLALAQGKSVAHGMRSFFTFELQMLVEIGQQAGCLNELLAQYQSYTQRRRMLINTCIRNIIYPLSVFLAAVFALVFVGTQIIPRFQQVVAETELPMLATSLQITAEMLLSITPWLCILAMAVAVLIFFALEHWRSPVRARFEWLLPFSVYKTYNGIYLLQGISLLLNSRLSLAKIMQMFESRSNAYLAHHVALMRASLAAGEVHLHKVFSTGLLSKATLYRLQFASATQQNKAIIFERLASRLVADGERSIHLHQRTFIIGCYATSLACIFWLLLSMGALFTELAQHWS